MSAQRKSDDDVAPRAAAADATRIPDPEAGSAQPLRKPQSGGLSMDAVFYLVGYAAITAAVLSFFGWW